MDRMIQSTRASAPGCGLNVPLIFRDLGCGKVRWSRCLAWRRQTGRASIDLKMPTTAWTSASSRLQEKQEETADILRDVALRLDENQRAGNVPTETDLAGARFDRDQIWQLLRRQWFDGEGCVGG